MEVVVSTYVYLLNRIPTKSVINMTPYESWKGKIPSIGHFIIFRYIAHAHVPFETRKILDAKIEKCIYVSYSEETKGYKLYNLVT